MASSSDNPLLSKSPLPFGAAPFDAIKPEHFIPAYEAAIQEARANIDSIKNNSEPASFANTIEALEMASEHFGYVASIYHTMLALIGGEEYHALSEPLSHMASSFSSDISLDPAIFARVKDVHDMRDDIPLETVEKTLLQDTYDGFVRSGALLNDADKETLRAINAELSPLASKFSKNVIDSSAQFELKITDEADLAGLPEFSIESAKHAAEEKGYADCWLFTLDYPSYGPFMTYAKTSELRHKMWEAFSNRAYKDEFDNCAFIEKITDLRTKRVALLGYDTYADFVLEHRMAKSAETVMAFLDKLLATYRPSAEADLKILQAYAKDKDGVEELKQWDIGYYSEKRKEELYAFSDEELRPYFPLETVLDGTFAHFKKLFNLDFKPRTDLPVWHEDVKAFEVVDQDTGDLFGLLYTDFYVRKNKRSGAWQAGLRDHGRYDGEQLPALVEIVCNFAKPTPSKPSLLTHNDVLTLFHEMGHAVHTLLGRTKYPSTSGANVKWDFVELPSQVQENWLYERETLNMVSGHYETGEKMPDDLVEKMRKAQTYMTGWVGLRQVSLAMFDMKVHMLGGKIPAGDVAKFEEDATKPCALMPKRGGPFATSFSHIFAGGYAAGYYSYKWAEVLDADTFELFKEKGLYDRESALRYRHEILEKGGSEEPDILYKRFRGREADPEALLRREGLLKKAA
ncbi:MAG: M3 family metallopeptidase [Pseudobdellovibrionaceae bacterium]